MKNVLFVCTGNTCRSAMAEAWLRHLCERDGLDWTVRSAGLDAYPGDEASTNARLAAAQAGADLSHHSARRFSAYLADEADVIAVMTHSHLARLVKLMPEAAGKTKLLMSYSKTAPDSDVPDPFGGGLAEYENCFRTMKEAIENLKDSLIEKINNQPKDEKMQKIIDWQSAPKGAIGIASDHGGFELKKQLIAFLSELGFQPKDFGPFELDPKDDYPDFGAPMSAAVSKGELPCGILLCRSGVGMGITANRFHGVRAVVAYSTKVAKASRDHNCSNVLVIPADYLDLEAIKEIITVWTSSPFSNDQRHINRLEKAETKTYDDIAAIRSADPEIAMWIDKEAERQNDGIELIASENFTSTAIRAAQGSVLTNKYAEGYPGKRYYGGCQFIDEIERLAIKRACELFGAEAANVQPHAGSQANMAVYFALLNPGDTVLSMSLDHGGHLTHGHPMNFSGKLFNIVPYGVNPETEMIDYDEIERLAMECKPRMILAGASAYPRIIDFARLRQIADKANAYLFVDMAHIAGLVAAGVHPSPVPYCDVVTTTTHKTLRGPRSGLILCKEKYIKAINSKVFPGLQGGPLEHVIAAKAICFKEAMTPEFKAYQQQIVKNAAVLAQALKDKGFRIVSGGTDNHLMLVDLRPKHATGKEVQIACDKAHITLNKNMIPFDPEKPFVTSGVRIGTPAVTTRGMKEAEMLKIADFIDRAVSVKDDDAALAKIGEEVVAFAANFPMPQF